MFKTKALKLMWVIGIILSFLFAFSFTAGCKGAEAPEEVAAEEAPEGVQEEAPDETTGGMPEEEVEEAVGGPMIIESPSFISDEMIPSKYSCDAENINPTLTISGVPENAKSLVLIVDDPDAPGKTWVHWIVWNIDPGTTEISENSVPAGAVEGLTDFKVPGYGGPCPPSGTHHYYFKLYALDITLDIDASSNIGNIEAAMGGHILDNTALIGLYERN